MDGAHRGSGGGSAAATPSRAPLDPTEPCTWNNGLTRPSTELRARNKTSLAAPMRSLGPAILTLFAPAVAYAGSPGWITECPYSHSAKDDPIKFPGRPGASHLHDFFG